MSLVARNEVITTLIEIQRAGISLPPGPALEHLFERLEKQARQLPHPEPIDLKGVLFGLCAFGRSSSLEPCEFGTGFDLNLFEMCDFERGSHTVYGEIATRIADVCGGALRLTLVDCSESTLTVQVDGEVYHFVYEYDDDWVDGTVFEDLAALLIECGARKRLVYLFGAELFAALLPDQVQAFAELVRRLAPLKPPAWASARETDDTSLVGLVPGSPPERLKLAKRCR